MSFGGNNDNWEWGQEDEFRLDADSPLAISRSLWDELTQSEEDSRNLFETTPIKSYRESECPECPVSSGDSQGSREPTSSTPTVHGDRDSPHLKRRRMLHFSASDSETATICDQQIGPFQHCGNSLMEEREDFQISDPESVAPFWFSRKEETYSSVSGSLDQSSESWMARCFNDGEIQCNSEDPNSGGAFDDQIDVSEFCQLEPSELDTEMWQEPASSAPNVVLTVKKAVSQRSATTPVAYPFALIKPCGVQGDVTLNDINQRILTPSSRSVHSKEDTRSPSIPTSAFSGKAVVALTKIHTEGKGSITIMRTKG
eukprot:Gb_29485 [translate_table: standard]